LCCAIQIAIVGTGNKNYGSVKFNNKEHTLQSIFEKLGIKYKNLQDSKLKEDELTPRRLVRVFRYQVKDFIEKRGKSSYLWRKYCTNADREKYKYEVYPGAEHCCDTEIGLVLYETYKNLDEKIGTKFTERIKRIFQARDLNISYE